MATIVLTGGGTAGHCTPHLALLPHLKKYFEKIYYIGSKNGIEKNIIETKDIPYFSISCVKFNRSNLLSNVKIPFILYNGIKQAKKILIELKPDVVFSKGGYVSLPTIIAASKLNIPVLTHESDFTLGLANKISSKYCKKILTSFPETAKTIKNGLFVGSPIRKFDNSIDRSEKLKCFSLSGDKPILLVTGGSQGSKAINGVLRESLSELLPKFDIIHLCGKNNIDKKITKKGYVQLEFTDKIDYAFDVCTICVSRAGANTLFELLYKKIPCLLIPLPKGNSRGDQVLNAEYFYKKGSVCVLNQDCLTSKSFVNQLNSLYSNRYNIKRNLEENPINDESEKIAKIIFDYAKN